MKKLIVGLVMLAGITSLASAEEGDAARGETLVQQCSACHGAGGASTTGSFPKLAGQGEAYRGGNPETGVPACAGCHSPTGAGNPPAAFPMLSGQHADYIESQLHKFQAGYRADEPSEEARTNDGESMMMRATAFRLKDFEIEALASYINGLH